MAGVVTTARLSARIASRYAPRGIARRGFRSSSQSRAAQNYTMPALSPTMTEGNIASWKIKEGDSFAAGDVLLEIETDKATMDVEAQDDGILMKITMPDGSKGVQVGQRIGVTAEPGDDIGSLEMPADDSQASKSQSKPAEDNQESKSESARTEKSAAQDSQPAQEQSQSQPESSPSSETTSQAGKSRTPKYPLYPSVEHLLHTNGLSAQDADKINATGPGGRLLKGDVLAYLGKIEKDYSANSSARLDKLAHLDLSNIELAAKPEAKPKEPEQKAEPELPKETEVALPISLSAVLATQKRVKDTLGIHIPLTTFILRASTLANDHLPINRKKKPTADDLFNAVLGLDKVHKASNGDFFPDVVDLSSVGVAPAVRSSRKPDIIDLLAPKTVKPSPRRTIVPIAGDSASAERLFSVVAVDGEEARATEFLARMKFTLEENPGSLVLS